MKKIFAGLTLVFSLFILVACNGGADEGLVISKVLESSDIYNSTLELYNNSDKDIALDKFSIDIYTNGAKEIGTTFQLEGTISANDYFIIVGNKFDSELGVDADFIYEEEMLPFNGNDVIQLSYKGKAHDVIGTIGSHLEFYRNLTLIRLGEKEDYTASKEYERFNFIQYGTDMFKYIDNDDHEIKTLEQLYEGPRLDQKYKDMTFLNPDNANVGLGGAALVTSVTSIADGDTATFITTEEGVGGGQSFRYYYIDTPEVNGPHVTAEPWGYVASKYNKEYQLNDYQNKEIYVQSVPNYTLTDTHGRSIGLIWINDTLSQFLIVSEGLSTPLPISFDAYDLSLTHKDIPYLTYMLFAEKRARDNGWGMFGYPGNPDGEKAPDWNYQTYKNSTENPVWQPNLPMPWDN